MSEKIKMPSIDSVMPSKKDRGKKKLHGLVFYNDAWVSMSETAISYGLSISKYVEVLHDLYLQANSKNK